MAGATPKSTKSASESNSAPKREVPFSARAMRPSRPSSTAAAAIALTAHSIEPSKANRIAVNPRHNASSVMRLGMSRRSGTARNRRTRSRVARGGRGDRFGLVHRGRPSRKRISSGGIAAAAPRRPDMRDHRLAGDRSAVEADDDARVFGHVDVDARTKADQSEAIARGQMCALFDEADDAPRDQAGDLHHAEDARRGLDDDPVALVVLARLVEVGAEEKTRGDRRCAPLAPLRARD